MNEQLTEEKIELKLTQSETIPLDVELDCPAGELLALVGPSGSGKTTVLRAIAGLYKPQQGVIRCHGETWQNSNEHIFIPTCDRHVGLVFQNYALFPHLTVLENILLALGEIPKQAREPQAREHLKQVHLEGLEARYPKNLSGGQQQRVAVARALARKPKVLLLDEPFSAVDQVTRRKLHRELRKLRESLSIPMILVTHDLEESALLADRIALLYKGKILQTGSPDELVSRPKSATVARLMDQQNLFTAQVMEHDLQQQKTILRWRGIRMEVRLQSDYPINERVCWTIEPASILLHRRDRPSQGDLENPMQGTIVEYMEVNGLANFLLEIDKELKIRLSVYVPLHVARRNLLGLNAGASISLLSEGIHLMPYQPLRRET